jgi:hypothetical protein
VNVDTVASGPEPWGSRLLLMAVNLVAFAIFCLYVSQLFTTPVAGEDVVSRVGGSLCAMFCPFALAGPLLYLAASSYAGKVGRDKTLWGLASMLSAGLAGMVLVVIGRTRGGSVAKEQGTSDLDEALHLLEEFVSDEGTGWDPTSDGRAEFKTEALLARLSGLECEAVVSAITNVYLEHDFGRPFTIYLTVHLPKRLANLPQTSRRSSSATLLAKYESFKEISTELREDLAPLFQSLADTPESTLDGDLVRLARSWQFARAEPFAGDADHIADLLFRCVEEDAAWARREVASGEMRDFGFAASFGGDGKEREVFYLHFLVKGYPGDFFLGHAVRRAPDGSFRFVHHKDGIAEML